MSQSNHEIIYVLQLCHFCGGIEPQSKRPTHCNKNCLLKHTTQIVNKKSKVI